MLIKYIKDARYDFRKLLGQSYADKGKLYTDVITIPTLFVYFATLGLYIFLISIINRLVKFL